MFVRLGLSDMNIAYILEVASCLSLDRQLDLIPAAGGEGSRSFSVFPVSLKAKNWRHDLGSVNQNYLPHSLNLELATPEGKARRDPLSCR